jgi:hypothetical protein
MRKKLLYFTLFMVMFMNLLTPIDTFAASKQLVTSKEPAVRSDFNISYNSKGLVSRLTQINSSLETYTDAKFSYYSDGRLKKVNEVLTNGSTTYSEYTYTYKYNKKKQLTKISVKDYTLSGTTNEPDYTVTVKKNKTIVKRTYSQTSYLTGYTGNYIDTSTYTYKNGFITKDVTDSYNILKDNTITTKNSYTLDSQGRVTHKDYKISLIETAFTYSYEKNESTINRIRTVDGKDYTQTDIFKLSKKSIDKKVKKIINRQQSNIYNSEDLTDFVLWAL